MKNGGILVGTFIRGDKLPRRKARNIFEIFECNKIFCFETKENDENVFLLTFNISLEEKEQKLQQFKEKYKNSIMLHRNKQTNTLYTINSLNKLIEEQNGTQNKDFKVDWEQYKNTCILINKEKLLKIIPTKLKMVFKIEKE